MHFNSQICTTKEQAKLLLDLGLKKETADMGLAGDIPIAVENWETQDTTLIDSPAWSFHRLMVLCNVFYLGHRDYDSLISYLMYLIKEEYFNKEYFEKL